MLLLSVGFALAASGSGDPIGFLINYGVAGVVILLLVTGQLRTKAEVATMERVAEERREQIVALERALGAVMGQLADTLPGITHLAEVIEALPQSNEDRLKNQLAALTARLDAIQSRSGQ